MEANEQIRFNACLACRHEIPLLHRMAQNQDADQFRIIGERDRASPEAKNMLESLLNSGKCRNRKESK